MPSQLAQAISHAEGFSVTGSVSQRAHNPGDLVLGDRGHGTLGREGITVFPTDVDGWAALEHELDLIRSGHSHVYRKDMTIAQMAAKWTDTQQAAWALNVCDWFAKRGIMATVDTPLEDVL